MNREHRIVRFPLSQGGREQRGREQGRATEMKKEAALSHDQNTFLTKIRGWSPKAIGEATLISGTLYDPPGPLFHSRPRNSWFFRKCKRHPHTNLSFRAFCLAQVSETIGGLVGHQSLSRVDLQQLALQEEIQIAAHY